MIKVKITQGQINVLGHAGYAAPGFDIVCAAVSTLTQNLIKSIESLTRDPIEYAIESGKIILKYENVSERTKTLIDSFFYWHMQPNRRISGIYPVIINHCGDTTIKTVWETPKTTV